MQSLRSKPEILRRVVKLHALYRAGKLPGPEKHEVHPNLPRASRENYLYFTLPCALNFQRSSPALWQSALETFQDERTRYVFFPELVAKADPERVRRDLIRYRLAVQTHKHPAIWLKLCNTLYEDYNSDPREVLSEGEHDAQRVIVILQELKKHRFPYLGGIKLSNYWVFILTTFTDASLRNEHEISIIPDTHIIKGTIRLGLKKDGVKPPEVEAVWREVLAATGIHPGEMHSALWRWSRGGFRLEV
jgi:hypothetical protein